MCKGGAMLGQQQRSEPTPGGDKEWGGGAEAEQADKWCLLLARKARTSLVLACHNPGFFLNLGVNL